MSANIGTTLPRIHTVLCVLLQCLMLSERGHSFYDHNPEVIQLLPATFNEKVLKSDSLWIIEFFAPWCGHCKSLVPEWIKAAKALKGVVKVGAVNADEHKSLGGQYGVRGFPTIKVFGANKNSPEDYQGGRTAQAIVDTAMQKLKQMVQQRVSGKSDSGSSGGGGGGGGGQKEGDPKDVVELTDSNFEEKVLESEDMWLVEFYAPWCGHCKNLAPHWASAATELKGKAKLGALDATVHTVMASRFGIQGFPTIKYFPQGKKDASGEEYDGGRTGNDIVSWALDKLAENVPPPEIIQVTDEKVLKSACDDHQLCVVSILPHILDCQSECRNSYIKVLSGMGEKYKKKMWGWVWAEAGQQLELEESVGIGGFGYPAMVAINARKMKYALLKGSFSETGINEFLREVAVGRGSTAPVKGAKLPKIEEVEAWDGKDGELPPEEDIDLSDVELDDLEEDKTKQEL